jgi:hypothetical protein
MSATGSRPSGAGSPATTKLVAAPPGQRRRRRETRGAHAGNRLQPSQDRIEHGDVRVAVRRIGDASRRERQIHAHQAVGREAERHPRRGDRASYDQARDDDQRERQGELTRGEHPSGRPARPGAGRLPDVAPAAEPVHAAAPDRRPTAESDARRDRHAEAGDGRAPVEHDLVGARKGGGQPRGQVADGQPGDEQPERSGHERQGERFG